MESDFLFTNHGSICILTPLSEAARVWTVEFIPSEAQTWGDGIVIEPRYAQDILDGVLNDGLTVAQ